MKRPTAFLLGNLAFAIFMLVAIPFIRSGQSDFASYAKLDKDYVQAVLADGRVESLQDALKQTEVARALGHKEHVATLGVLQLATILLAVLFFVNAMMLYGMSRPQPVPARVPNR
ncbi:MAG: hypothetical protein HKN82_09110 [Akkermansiaceae bacterium]|nr:hypothetical protein [Akkermansiaceae bacterium]NNM30978.1 hypothetical protein [Akkermansiaceae bacterium]